MPAFDISAPVDWQEVTHAVQQTLKEVEQRFDFKGVKAEIQLDAKKKSMTLWCSVEDKLEALNDVLQSKLIKRGVSLLSLEYSDPESAFSSSIRQEILVQSGISKEKAKIILEAVKKGAFKVQAQIQEDQVRVTAKSRDELQKVIHFLKTQQDRIKVPMQFGNFRD